MLTTLPTSCAVIMKFGDLNFPEPSGPLRLVTGLIYLLSRPKREVKPCLTADGR